MNLELVHNETTFMPFSSGLLSCASPGRLSDAGDLLCAHSALLIPVARVRRRRRVHRIWDDVEMVGEDERTGEGDNGSEDQDEDEEMDPENEEEDEYVPSTTRPSNALRQDDYLPDHLFKSALSHAGKKLSPSTTSPPSAEDSPPRK